MKERSFWSVLYTVVGICLALTIAHFLYVIYAYQHCSIIGFIAGELW